MFRLALLTIGLAAVFAGSMPAHAQAKGYAGGVIGMSIPDATDTSARPMFGILGGARLDGEWGVGGFYYTSAKDETINNATVKFNYSLYGMEGSYHFEGLADNAYLAARLGLAKVTAGSTSFSPMLWGLALGYDYMIKENFSIGAEGGFMSIFGETKSGGVHLDGFTALNFLAALKFWF